MSIELTARQSRVLDFISRHIADRGYPPTLREIGAALGIGSTNGVNDHLRALERKGYLERADGISRGMRVLDPSGQPAVESPRVAELERHRAELERQIARLSVEIEAAKRDWRVKRWEREVGERRFLARREVGR